MGWLPQLCIPCVTRRWGLAGLGMLAVPQPATWGTWGWGSPCFGVSVTPSRLPHLLVSHRVLVFLHLASHVLELTSFLSTGLCPPPWSLAVCGGPWQSMVVCGSPWRSPHCTRAWWAQRAQL